MPAELKYCLNFTENEVVDKTGKPATSKICSFSPNANRARRMEQILLLAGFPVLSTTVYSLYIHFLYN